MRLIAVDPAGSKRIFVLFGGAARAGAASWLCLSEDGGVHWKRIKDFAGSHVLQLYFDHALHAITGSGIASFAAGEWTLSAGPGGGDIASASAGDGLLYATNAAGIHISSDGGKTWQDVANPLPGSPRYLAIACSAHHPETAYVGFSGMMTGDVPRGWFGIARTSDSGRTWTPVYREAAGKPAPNVERAWIEEFYGGTGPVIDLGVSPTDPNICFATDGCPRSFRTLDGGKTWQQIISERKSSDHWTTTGFDVTTCYGVHTDPFDARRMFISYTDVGLFQSTDGGATWKSSIAGIPRKWQNTSYWVEFDPDVKGLMWGGFSRIHDLPRPKMWQRHTVAEYSGGIGTSTDGGDHWTVTSTGLPETPITHLILDPTSPKGNRTLYACGFGRGVYKSTDNGKSWALQIQGIEKQEPFAWRITRARNGTLYLVAARRSENSFRSDSEDGALYRSTDGAAHWTRMKLPERVNGPTGLSIDPADQRRLYLSTWGATADGHITGGGVYLSTDAGENWRNIFHGSQHVYDVTVDNRHPDILYNCGFESGAWRSTDRGATWTRIRGFNFKWGHRVIPDPVDDTKIYITTFGGSVWHGPAAGDPGAQEDTLTSIKVID